MSSELAREVVAVTNRLFSAMRERDQAAMRTLIHPRALVYSLRATGLQVRTAEEFIAACAGAAESIDERIDGAEVRIEGDLASLWAPYSVHRGTRYSHRGVDSFQFVREDGAWKLVCAAYTVGSDQ